VASPSTRTASHPACALADLRARGLELLALTIDLPVRLVRDFNGLIDVGAIVPGQLGPRGEVDDDDEGAEAADEEESFRFSAAKRPRNRAKNRPPPSLEEPTQRLMTADFFDPSTAHDRVVLAALRTVPAAALHLRVSYSGVHYYAAAALPAAADAGARDAASLVRRFAQLRDRNTVDSCVKAGSFLWQKVERRTARSLAPRPGPPCSMVPSLSEQRGVQDAAQR